MWSWFGGQGNQATKDAPKKAILDLRTQLDMLSKREKYLETQIAEQENIAKANVTKNKNVARTALKRKKAHEQSLEQTSNQITMLENQIYSIEAANINQETLRALQNANAAMKKIHGGLTMDKVDQIMEETEENKALSHEIGNAMANSGDQVDEDELEQDLADLEQEALDEKMLKTGTVPVLPTGPSAEPKGKEPAKVVAEDEDEEAELARLQKEMALA